MSRRVVGYVNGKAVWSENVPAENPQWGAHIGGSSIVDASPFMAKVVRPQTARYEKPRDYHESVLKGHETRRLRGENVK